MQTLPKCVLTPAVRHNSTSGTGSKFNLTCVQHDLQQLARKFAREEIMPKAAYYDRTGEFPWQIVKKAHSLGLMNVYVPKEIGKTSLDTAYII